MRDFAGQSKVNCGFSRVIQVRDKNSKHFAAAVRVPFSAGMNPHMELKPPAVLDACEANGTAHPPERALRRYVSNEMGPRRKKVLVQHLEGCPECRTSVAKLNAIARTFREWERNGIMQMAQAYGR
jgi:hypothetical protein